MLVTKPLKGTVIYEYYPQWLVNSPVGRAYGEHTYFDIPYWNNRLASGLLYSTKEEVINRIEFERSQLKYIKSFVKN